MRATKVISIIFSDTAARFSTFFEKTLVSRVNRRMPIRTDRLPLDVAGRDMSRWVPSPILLRSRLPALLQGLLERPVSREPRRLSAATKMRLRDDVSGVPALGGKLLDAVDEGIGVPEHEVRDEICSQVQIASPPQPPAEHFAKLVPSRLGVKSDGAVKSAVFRKVEVLLPGLAFQVGVIHAGLTLRAAFGNSNSRTSQEVPRPPRTSRCDRSRAPPSPQFAGRHSEETGNQTPRQFGGVMLGRTCSSRAGPLQTLDPVAIAAKWKPRLRRILVPLIRVYQPVKARSVPVEVAPRCPVPLDGDGTDGSDEHPYDSETRRKQQE